MVAAGSGSTEEVYKLAIDVFNNIYKDCNGDPEKMKAAMEKFNELNRADLQGAKAKQDGAPLPKQ